MHGGRGIFLEDAMFIDQREGVSQRGVWLKDVCTSAQVLW